MHVVAVLARTRGLSNKTHIIAVLARTRGSSNKTHVIAVLARTHGSSNRCCHFSKCLRHSLGGDGLKLCRTR